MIISLLSIHKSTRDELSLVFFMY